MIAKLCHSLPLNISNEKNISPLFGMPFVVSFLNIHTRRQLHKAIYERLFMWLGEETLITPPTNDQTWDDIFKKMCYTLKLLPKDYSFEAIPIDDTKPEAIPIDDIIFVPKTKAIDIVIEWPIEIYNNIKSVVNTVVRDKEYGKWKCSNDGNTPTLYHCIDAYVAEQQSGCKIHSNATKKLDLWSFPQLLVIHLKRFQQYGPNSGKDIKVLKTRTFIDFPVKGLDLTPYRTNPSNSLCDSNAPIYDLYAVSCHVGSFEHGHNSAYALNIETKKWYFFNDAAVIPSKESDVISSAAYILFYTKRDSKNESNDDEKQVVLNSSQCQTQKKINELENMWHDMNSTREKLTTQKGDIEQIKRMMKSNNNNNNDVDIDDNNNGNNNDNTEIEEWNPADLIPPQLRIKKIKHIYFQSEKRMVLTAELEWSISDKTLQIYPLDMNQFTFDICENLQFKSHEYVARVKNNKTCTDLLPLEVDTEYEFQINMFSEEMLPTLQPSPWSKPIHIRTPKPPNLLPTPKYLQITTLLPNLMELKWDPGFAPYEKDEIFYVIKEHLQFSQHPFVARYPIPTGKLSPLKPNTSYQITVY
eukprot:477460_1